MGPNKNYLVQMSAQMYPRQKYVAALSPFVLWKSLFPRDKFTGNEGDRTAFLSLWRDRVLARLSCPGHDILT